MSAAERAVKPLHQFVRSPVHRPFRFRIKALIQIPPVAMPTKVTSTDGDEDGRTTIYDGILASTVFFIEVPAWASSGGLEAE